VVLFIYDENWLCTNKRGWRIRVVNIYYLY
jgi:hypothetical protein